jgi:hypothetical protein
VAERLVASQKGLSSMQLVSYRTSLRVRHTLSRHPYGGEVLCVFSDLSYSDFGPGGMLGA